MSLDAMEVFGFNTGSHELKVVAGQGLYCLVEFCQDWFQRMKVKVLNSNVFFHVVWMNCYRGMGETELNGICFKFQSDLEFVSYQKKLYSIADFLHHACTVHGVAEVELANHQLIPKTYPVDAFSATIIFHGVAASDFANHQLIPKT